jgi:hypothetical protein
MGPRSGCGWNRRCATAVGTIAESTTTVISKENCVRSMMCAFNPYNDAIVPKRQTGRHQQCREDGMGRREPARERIDTAELWNRLRGEEKRQDAEVRPHGSERHVHSALDEEERRQERKCHDAKPLLLLPMLGVVRRQRKTEDERGQDRVRVCLVAEPRTAARAKLLTAPPSGVLWSRLRRGHQPRRAVRREPHRASAKC